METYKTRPKDWDSDFTFSCYVPISIVDVYSLYSYSDIVSLWNRATNGRTTTNRNNTNRNRLGGSDSGGQTTMFFGNHPLRFVQVAGRVSHVEYPIASSAFKLSKFSISDGTTDSSLECISKDPQFALDEVVTKGAIVCVQGNLASFDSTQVEVHKVFVFDPQRYNIYFMLRQHGFSVRKHVLEWPAEAFEYFLDPVGVSARPTKSVVDVAHLIDNLASELRQSETVLGLKEGWFGESTKWPFL